MFWRCICFVLLLCPFAQAQIELGYVLQKSMVGVTTPRIIGERILIGNDSKPTISQVAIVTVTCKERVRVVARKSLQEFGTLEKLTEGTNVETGVTVTEYLLSGSGTYLLDAMSFSFDRSLSVTIGQPDPPIPPDPPDPGPNPPPVPPGPVKSFHVILVKESGSTLNAEQTAISGSKSVRDYLTAKTTPEGGLAGWREYDPQQNVTNEKPSMKALWVAAKSSITNVPCMVVEVNGKVSVLAYPKNPVEAVKTLKELGGN